MPFIFTNALFLAALAGLGIPVLIHLLLKRKNQKLKFSTLRFFQPQDTKSTSKRKLRNILLLALRLLIFALIVLAFARPFLPQTFGGAAAQQRRQVVVVLDRSLSLTAKDAAGVRWDAAKKIARDVMAALGNNDRAALITLSGRADVVSGFAPASVVAQKVAPLTAAPAAADLGEGLREAARLIASSDPKFLSSIVVVGDMQRSGAEGIAGVPLPRNLEVKFMPVGEPGAPNLAVTDLQFAVSETNSPFASVSNFGDAPANGVTAEYRLDGKVVWSRSLGLPAGGSTNFDLALPKLAPGWHDAELRLKGGDALAADDSRHATFHVPTPVRLLVIENRTEVRIFQEQSFFLISALDPFTGSTNAGAGRFVVDKAGPGDIAAKLRPRRTGASGTNSAPYDAVFLPAVKSLAPDAVAALNAFVQGGGGLFFFGGDALTPSRFNAEFAALLPAQVLEAAKADEDLPWRVGEYDRKGPVFGVFAGEGGGNPAVAEFTRRHALTPARDARVLARFDDGVPFVLARSAGNGRVIFANTSADTAWTDWPKHKTFVPWVCAAAGYLANRADERLYDTGRDLVSGVEAVMELGTGAARTSFTLRPPDGNDANINADAGGKIAFEPAQPGIHSLRDDTGRELFRFAVNVPASESDLTALNVADAGRKIARREDDGSEAAGSLFGGDQKKREFWRLLLLAAVALLFVETVVSNRTAA